MSAWKSAKKIGKISRRVQQARRVARVAKRAALVGAGVSAGLAAAAYVAHKSRTLDLHDKVVVITGGSRGLGLAMAEECAKRGARIAICARDAQELETARKQVRFRYAAHVFAKVCDVTNSDEVQEFLSAVLERFGRIDVLIANAGTISVGPLESQTLTDYQEAMDVMYWGTVYPTLAVLPHMRERGEGRIAMITSFGGKIAVPHLTPYSAAKFAAVGFSEGLRAELRKDGIRVTTVCPGLMRTGSHLNAWFKGNHRSEFTWFSFGASTPLVSIGARRAARKIIDSVCAGDAELIITPQAKLAAAVHGVFPGTVVDILGVVNRFLPSANGNRRERHTGFESQTRLTKSFLQALGRKAARELNQLDAEELSA
jgi:short-subunit dehydrogenase